MIRSARLLLRDWRDADLEPFAALNAHPEVMRYFPAALSRAESDALAARIRAELAERGFGFWAVESPGEAPFLGFVGLGVPRFEAPFTPCIEIGWRLAWRFWGKGYASEAAQRRRWSTPSASSGCARSCRSRPPRTPRRGA